MSVIILDLDNCIADDSWRIPRINWQTDNPIWRYHDYHSLSGFDMAHNHELYINTRHDIVIFTARPIMYQAVTIEWLKRHGVGCEMLLMRDMEDHCHSVELKQKQLNALFENSSVKAADIVGAFDDRPDVVQMYRKFGIPAEIRFVHDMCAYTKPEGVQDANSGQSNGADAGDVQGARQDLQGELFDDRGSPLCDVPRGNNAEDSGRPQQVAPVSDDDDQSYPTR